MIIKFYFKSTKSLSNWVDDAKYPRSTIINMRILFVLLVFQYVVMAAYVCKRYNGKSAFLYKTYIKLRK